MTTMDDFDSLEMDQPSILGWFDEDAVYKEKTPEDPRSELDIFPRDLYQQQGEREGAVRSYSKGDASGPLVFSEDKSNYSIDVERLVWVDGYRKTTMDGEHKKHHDPMTLVVLCLRFGSRVGSENSIRSAEAEIRFQSDRKRGPDPEVVAWGPFRHTQTWNVSKSQSKINLKADLSIAGGPTGQQLSAGAGRERETSWDQIDFDMGTSTRLYNLSKTSSKPHGVRWNLLRNKVHGQSITPEVRVAVLVSRKQASQPYLATFRIAVRTGTMSALKSKSQSLLGISAGRPVTWRTTPSPGNEEGCFDEGQEIIKHIDTDNLGALVRDPSDSTNLDPSWLNTEDRFEVPVDSAAAGTPNNAAADPRSQKNEEAVVIDRSAGPFPPSPPRDPDSPPSVTYTAAVVTDHHPTGPFPPRTPDSPHSPASVTRPSTAGVPAHGESGPEPPIGIYREPNIFMPPPGVDHQGYSRLVSLEARAAQAEARLAAQDVLIFRLQKALARVEQVVAAN